MRIYRRSVVEIIIFFVIAILSLAFFLTYKLYVVSGTSMEPTLYAGERVVIDRTVYLNAKPRKGEVVAMVSPTERRLLYVKRIMAEEGDIVDYSAAGLYINSQRIREVSELNGERFTIKKGYVFVLGDNRSISYDSRFFGLVQVKNIVGQAKMVIWPLSKLRTIN